MDISVIQVSQVRPEGSKFSLSITVVGTVVTLKCNSSVYTLDMNTLALWRGFSLVYYKQALLAVALSEKSISEDALPIFRVQNVADVYLVCAFVGSEDTLQSSVTPLVVDSYKEYVQSLPTAQLRKTIADLKTETVYEDIQIYSSVATLEAQVDLLASILLEIVSKDANLLALYGESLKGLIAVGNYDGTHNSVESIIKDKTMIRVAQKAFFNRKATI